MVQAVGQLDVMDGIQSDGVIEVLDRMFQLMFVKQVLKLLQRN